MANSKLNAFVYDNDVWGSALQRDYLIQDPAGVSVYENALMLPPRYIPGSQKQYGDGLLEGGVCDQSGTFVAGLHRSYGKDNVNKNCIRAYEPSEGSVVHSDESVIFGGIITSHFGHMLCDGLTRLWYVSAFPDDTRRVAFVVMPGQAFALWEMLELAGVDRARALIVESPTRFREIVVPGETSFTLKEPGYKAEWKILLDRIRGSVEPKPYEKVYLTRTGLKFSGCVGEEYFEDFYRRQGFEIVSPEKLSFGEQVAVMAGAKEIATTMGTLAMQVIFANPDTRVTVLNRSGTMAPGAIMAACAADAIVTYVDVFMSILPEEQAGNSVFLLGPTRQWREYLKSSEYGLDALGSYSLSDNLLEYVKLWGSQYDSPKKYDWIRNETVPDIIRRINKFLLGKNIGVSTYGIPKKYEKLYKRVDELEGENAMLADDLERAESRALIASYASLGSCSSGLKITGSIDTTLIDVPSVADAVLTVSYERDGFCESEDYAVDVENADGAEGLFWESVIPVQANGGDYLGCTVRAALRCSMGGVSRTMPVKVAASRQSLAILGPWGQTSSEALSVSREKDGTLGTVVSIDSLFDTSFAYEIESFEWDGDDLSIEFHLEHPLALSEIIDVELALRSDREEDGYEVVLKPAKARAVLSDYPQCAYRIRFNPLAIRGDSGYEAVRRYDMHLVLRDTRTGEIVEETPFGRKRPVGSFGVFASHGVVASGRCAIPVEDAHKMIGFVYCDVDAMLDRPLSPKISDMSWEGSKLRLSGSYCAQNPFKAAIKSKPCLADEGGTPFFDLWDFELEGDSTWTACLDAARLFERDACGTYSLAVFKEFEGSQAVERFGWLRPPGSIKRFTGFCGVDDGRVIVPVEMGDKNLGISLETVQQALDRSAKSYIRSLSWSDTVLTMVVTTDHAMRSVEGFEIGFSLLHEGGSVKALSCERVEYEDSNLDAWKVEGDIRELLLHSEFGDWQFAVSKSFGGVTSIEPFGKYRQKGTYAVFSEVALSTWAVEIKPKVFGDTLGFSVNRSRKLSKLGL